MDGLLPSQMLRDALSSGWLRTITGGQLADECIQPASLDLRVGPVAHRLQCSFLPSNGPVIEPLSKFSMGTLDLRAGAILERNRPYLIQLQEWAHLPGWIRGKANPKSSTGRLDIFTRLITDGSPGFDYVEAGYNGPLYIEVVPRSFTVEVREGDSLNQIRLMAGNTALSDMETFELHRETPLLYRDGRAVSQDAVLIADGLSISVDVSGNTGRHVGFRARGHSGLVTLSARGEYAVDPFWEPVLPDSPRVVVLNPESFYLLMSQDEVRIPPGYAAEMTAYDPTNGELRTHYAGFFDPGFGHRGDLIMGGGTRAALEVRAHDVPFAVEHGQRLCRLRFERMAEIPDLLYGAPRAGSSYAEQRVAVGKQFHQPIGSLDT